MSTVPDPEVKALADGNNQFALDLYTKLKSGEGNLFFSPYSISTALAMTAVGAKGDSHSEMASTLHFPKGSANVDKTFKALVTQLEAAAKADPKPYELRVANALWGQEGEHFLPEFLKATESNYGAGLHEVDFKTKTEAARSTINDWIAKQTNDKIQDMIPSSALTAQTSLVLTNAIYFLGNWQDPFVEGSTQADAPFTTLSGKTTKAPLMSRSAYYAHADAPTFQTLEIPYKGGDLGMIVLLPKSKDGLPALEALLEDGSNLKEAVEAMKPVKVNLALPKFKLDESISLGPLLSSLGMPQPFDPAKADFSGMNGKHDLFISQVIHKAFVDVNEKGTEAAAATAVVMMAKSAMMKPVQPIEFKADHPFLFLIRERSTGSILFVGRLVDPGK